MATGMDPMTGSTMVLRAEDLQWVAPMDAMTPPSIVPMAAAMASTIVLCPCPVWVSPIPPPPMEEEEEVAMWVSA